MSQESTAFVCEKTNIEFSAQAWGESQKKGIPYTRQELLNCSKICNAMVCIDSIHACQCYFTGTGPIIVPTKQPE